MSAEGFSRTPPAFLRIVEAVDLRVLVPALALTGLGLASLGSTRPDYLGAQVTGVAVGIAAALALVLIPYRTLLAAAWPLWFVSLFLLVLVLTPAGTTVNGARRWLRVGGVQIQPSEIAKVAEVLVLARYIRFREDHRTLKGLLVPFLLVLIPALLVLREPDLGTALLLVPPLFAMLWAAGARSRHLLMVVAFAVASLPLVYQNMKDYQRQRVDTYLPAWIRPAPADEAATVTRFERIRRAEDERNARHHIERAEIAVAAGGVTGQGWGEGRMNLGNKVPEDWTDFIYVVHAEEWGFAGTALLVGLLGLLLFAVASVAQECREPGARLLCVGALVTLGCQSCVNLMMTLRLAPVTGVPLPFLSYGRSAMLCTWVLVGLVLHAKAREPRVFTSSDFDR